MDLGLLQQFRQTDAAVFFPESHLQKY